ncbi:hypothetical protein FJTKL_05701 [Diaporthe vaccinii]|uniref:Uncharacterized protein n=1 Tax=Diaporthe vaccinii TaxID=105482 RepID=A0ABR4DRC3_9PEZI
MWLMDESEWQSIQLDSPALFHLLASLSTARLLKSIRLSPGHTPRLPHQSSPPPSHQPNDISPHPLVKILDKPNDKPDDKRLVTPAAPAKLPPSYSP